MYSCISSSINIERHNEDAKRCPLFHISWFLILRDISCIYNNSSDISITIQSDRIRLLYQLHWNHPDDLKWFGKFNSPNFIHPCFPTRQSRKGCRSIISIHSSWVFFRCRIILISSSNFRNRRCIDYNSKLSIDVCNEIL